MKRLFALGYAGIVSIVTLAAFAAGTAAETKKPGAPPHQEKESDRKMRQVSVRPAAPESYGGIDTGEMS